MEEKQRKRKMEIEKKGSVISIEPLSALPLHARPPLKRMPSLLFIHEGKNYADFNQFGV